METSKIQVAFALIIYHDWVKMYAGADRVSKKALTKLRSFKEATKLKQTILLFHMN